MNLDFQTLTDAVRDAAAIRVVERLQPAGGLGDKLFPPTYATTGDRTLKYAVEERRIEGNTVPCVLLDSVASQANRFEAALQDGWDYGELFFPVPRIDFTQEEGFEELGFLTALQTPHRIADALFRDAITSDDPPVPFRDSVDGKAFAAASVRHATQLFRLCPTALIFGVWDSTGPRGGSGEKFQRALVSEIIGVGFSPGKKTASRMDPLGIEANVNIYHRKDDPSDWTTDPEQAQRDKKGPQLFNRSGADGKGKPSAINHSNIAPSIDEWAGGVTVDYACQTTVLSMPALRRLRFPTDVMGQVVPPESRRETETAARTALAALALAAIVYGRKEGYDLRSRTLLVPETNRPLTLEIVPADGGSSDDFARHTLEVDDAAELLQQAADLAAQKGLPWERTPLTLRPMPKLVDLIRESRKLGSPVEVGAD